MKGSYLDDRLRIRLRGVQIFRSVQVAGRRKEADTVGRRASSQGRAKLMVACWRWGE
jgi:hypothetical protein